jgi:DNA modification methylase
MGGVILNADCLVALSRMPDCCVDMCLCSPPYWALRDYGVDGQLGLEPTPQEYITTLCDVFDEVKRVLKPTGTCWVNMGDTYSSQRWTGKGAGQPINKMKDGHRDINPERITDLPPKCLVQIPSRFAIEMENREWILRNEIIWHKPKCMPFSGKDRFTPDFEKLFFFTKSTTYHFEQQFEPLAQASVERAQYRWDCDRANNRTGVHTEKMGARFCNPRGRNKRCVWSINPRPFKGAHFATYPEELCVVPIKAGCPVDGIVLDIFAGAGTTLLAAKKLGRRYVGIELNPEYCRIIEARLKEAAPLEDSAEEPESLAA